MQLSQAIRLGSLLAPQAFGVHSHDRDCPRLGDILGLNTTTERVGICALQAAYEAGGCRSEWMAPPVGGIHTRGPAWAPTSGLVLITYHRPEWDGVIYSVTGCPQCGASDMTGRQITHLNDDHRWTREAIADFIERLELRLGLEAMDEQTPLVEIHP